MHAMNRELKSDNALLASELEKVKIQASKAAEICIKLQEEIDELVLYKTEAEAKLDQNDKKLKNTERELEVNTNFYKRYEEELVDIKKEFYRQEW